MRSPSIGPGPAYAAPVNDTAADERTGAGRPPLGDLLLVAAFTVVALGGVWAELHYASALNPAPSPVLADGWAYPLTLATAAALLARRSHPLGSAAQCLLGCAAYHFLGYPGFAPGVLLFAACYALACHSRPPLGPEGALGCALLLACLGWLVPALPPQTEPWYSFALSMPAMGMAAAAVLGFSARRSRAEHGERIRQTAAAAEERTGRRLAEERLRIARELHDVLAHTISVVLVQSSVALDVLDDSPAQAREAMTTVRGAARQAMPELRAALDLLRGTGSAAQPAPAPRPQPRLAQLPDLVGQIRDSGLPVELTMDQDLADLSPLLQLTAYRIIQESLTNVLRHADAPEHAVVVLRRDGAALSVEVTDDGRAGGKPPATNGFGLVGIRERAEALGGSAVTGPLPSGGFRVTARLPLESL